MTGTVKKPFAVSNTDLTNEPPGCLAGVIERGGDSQSNLSANAPSARRSQTEKFFDVFQIKVDPVGSRSRFKTEPQNIRYGGCLSLTILPNKPFMAVPHPQ